MLVNKKIESYINCEINVTGTTPIPFLNELSDEKSISSIF